MRALRNRNNQIDQYSGIIEELRRVAREPYESSDEFEQPRSQSATEWELSQRRLLGAIGQKAHVDLDSIFDEEQRRKTEKRRQISEAFARLESQEAEKAAAEKRRLHRIRARYFETFGAHLSGQVGKTELKFREPIFWSSDARPGRCTHHGTGIFSPWIGPSSQASAEIIPSANPPAHGFIRSCTSKTTTVTIQTRA